jgi:hypothetical protein
MTLVFACGACKTPLEGPANPTPGSVFKCLSCGQTETFETIRQVVGEFLQENARDKMSDMFRGITSRSETLRSSDSLGPKRVHRFVVVEADV